MAMSLLKLSTGAFLRRRVTNNMRSFYLPSRASWTKLKNTGNFVSTVNPKADVMRMLFARWKDSVLTFPSCFTNMITAGKLFISHDRGYCKQLKTIWLVRCPKSSLKLMDILFTQYKYRQGMWSVSLYPFVHSFIHLFSNNYWGSSLYQALF